MLLQSDFGINYFGSGQMFTPVSDFRPGENSSVMQPKKCSVFPHWIVDLTNLIFSRQINDRVSKLSYIFYAGYRIVFKNWLSTGELHFS